MVVREEIAFRESGENCADWTQARAKSFSRVAEEVVAGEEIASGGGGSKHGKSSKRGGGSRKQGRW